MSMLFRKCHQDIGNRLITSVHIVMPSFLMVWSFLQISGQGRRSVPDGLRREEEREQPISSGGDGVCGETGEQSATHGR